MFRQIRYLIEVEIDAQCMGWDDCFTDLALRPRELVLAAIREVHPTRETPLPQSESDDLVEWFSLISFMLDQILDDRDYLAADMFLDMDPAGSSKLKDQLGISEDYFTATQPDPTLEGLEAARIALRRICGALRVGPHYRVCIGGRLPRAPGRPMR